MSYLDRPRIHFTGEFQASPSTINNTPNNYNPANYNPDSLKPLDIELYWEPKGDGIFDLRECKVTAIETPEDASGAGSGDSLMATSVAAVYTGSPPKLVDLDPMQQNGSEIWGLTLMIGSFGGPYVKGTFEPIAFNGIWGNSQGQNTPRNSASGSAAYVSTLTNLEWNVGDSEVLAALQAASPERLSVRLVVFSHNNAPDTYAFNSDTFQAMAASGVPQAVLDQIASLADYVMNVDEEGNPKPQGSRGVIPTIQYVNYLLEQLLDVASINSYSAAIIDAARLPYEPWIDYNTGDPLPEQPQLSFNFGKLVGSVGPCAADEPTYVVPARTLAQASTETPSAWWASAKLDLASSAPSLTLDLANSLPIRLPEQPLWSEKLGTLSLAYYTGSGADKTYTTLVDSIDYSDPAFMGARAGMLTITDFGQVNPSLLASAPLALRSTVGGVTRTLLEENPSGLSVRADQFLYRMNPGMATTAAFNRGETNTLDLYVRKFGEVAGTDGLELSLTVMSPTEAVAYTLGTLGTSGTNGINEQNTSVPEGRLTVEPATVTVANGRATAVLRGADPGNPRGFVDGQVYFLRYQFTPAVAEYRGDPNDIVSVQIYDQHPITGTPTWENGIGAILTQYGMLYPIMGRFQLWTYEGVKQNRDKIERVFRTDFSQPLHMPATRDMSAIRRDLILQWFDAGMPEGASGGGSARDDAGAGGGRSQRGERGR